MNLCLLLIHYHLASNHHFDTGKLYPVQTKQIPNNAKNFSLFILTQRIRNSKSCFLLFLCYNESKCPYCCQKCRTFPQSETFTPKLTTVFQQKHLMNLLFTDSFVQISDYELERSNFSRNCKQLYFTIAFLYCWTHKQSSLNNKG